MSDITIKFTDTLVVVTCWCGMNHAVPHDLDNFQRRQWENGETQTSIYCPLGHVHIRAGEGRAKQLEASLARERARLDQEKAARKAEERSHAATKGALTKARTRAKNGVCPCCHRTFKQLARHMQTKHPDFDPESETR